MAEPAGVTPAGDPSVRDLVERLPDKMRTVVLLHYYADLSVHEIATLLGRADGTVKRTLFDARQRLQANLAAADLEGLR
jgi:RNA polymerase sigma-70 factor (ECF subfamily)